MQGEGVGRRPGKGEKTESHVEGEDQIGNNAIQQLISLVVLRIDYF